MQKIRDFLSHEMFGKYSMTLIFQGYISSVNAGSWEKYAHSPSCRKEKAGIGRSSSVVGLCRMFS